MVLTPRRARKRRQKAGQLNFALQMIMQAAGLQDRYQQQQLTNKRIENYRRAQERDRFDRQVRDQRDFEYRQQRDQVDEQRWQQTEGRRQEQLDLNRRQIDLQEQTASQKRSDAVRKQRIAEAGELVNPEMLGYYNLATSILKQEGAFQEGMGAEEMVAALNQVVRPSTASDAADISVSGGGDPFGGSDWSALAKSAKRGGDNRQEWSVSTYNKMLESLGLSQSAGGPLTPGSRVGGDPNSPWRQGNRTQWSDVPRREVVAPQPAPQPAAPYGPQPAAQAAVPPPVQAASTASAYGRSLGGSAPAITRTKGLDRAISQQLLEASWVVQDKRSTPQQRAQAYLVLNQTAGVPIPTPIRLLMGWQPPQTRTPRVPQGMMPQGQQAPPQGN